MLPSHWDKSVLIDCFIQIPQASHAKNPLQSSILAGTAPPAAPDIETVLRQGFAQKVEIPPTAVGGLLRSFLLRLGEIYIMNPTHGSGWIVQIDS